MSLVVVNTKQGTVSGVKIPDKDITVFKGIPFAAPPVGSLRWKAPQPAPAWEGIRKADRFMPAAWQSYHVKGSFYDREWGHKPFERSEDCLYLNIWTPAKSADEKLPVAVWIYGGGYMSGFAHENEFDGEAMSGKGVVYVSINYRLHAFGYLAHPDLDKESGHSGNYGVLDQIAALKWVHENIAAFGGDPGNVLVFGQSAGAGSTMSLVCSPLMKGIFQKAAIHSGLGGFMAKEDAYKSGQMFMEYCGYKSPLEMRDIPAEKIQEYFEGFFPEFMANPSAGRLRLPFTPYIDGYALHESYEDAIANGHHNDIQFIMGSTKDDMAGDSPVPWMPVAINKGMREFILKNEELGRKPNYLYFFNRALPGDDSGSWHSCDLWYIHGTMKNCWRPFEDIDYKISDAMITYWTNFMKTGDPNGGDLPEWKPYTREDNFIMVFGDSIGHGEPEFDPNPERDTARWRIQDHH